MAMLTSLEELQMGFLSPRSFRDAKTTHRLLRLELSKQRDLEPFHRGSVNVLDIEGIEHRYLLSGGANGALCIHDLLNCSGRLSCTFKVVCKVEKKSKYAHSFSIDTVQWYPFDTGIFTTSGMDNKLKIWDANVLRPADTFELPGKIFCHHMSPISTHHSLIATALDYPSVKLLDLKSGAKCHELKAHKGKVVSVRWSPSSEHLMASGGTDNKIFLWDIRCAKGYLRALDQHNGESVGSKKDLITAHNGIINCLRFTGDGLFLVSYGTDSHLRLWDVARGSNTLVNFGKVFNDNPRQCSIDLCYDSAHPMIFVPSESRVLVFDLFSGTELKTLVGHFDATNCCVYRPSLQELYSGGSDRNILLWSPDVDREVVESEGLGSARDSGAVSDAWSSDDD